MFHAARSHASGGLKISLTEKDAVLKKIYGAKMESLKILQKLVSDVRNITSQLT